jgi:hypothetical protein
LLLTRKRETRRDGQFGLQISSGPNPFRPVTPVLTIGIQSFREEVPEALIKACEAGVISVRVAAHVA